MLMNKEKILLVDDSKTIIKTLQNELSINNLFEIFIATNLKDAKKLIEEEKFFVAILDLELPDSSKGEVVDYALKFDIPSIILTGTYNKNLQVDISKKPIIDYIVKNSLEDIKTAVYMADNLTLYKGKRALIVDDSKLARIQIKQHLEQLKFEVYEASNAQEALQSINDEVYFDIITVDYQMPGSNGVELIQKIRQIQFKLRPIIFGVYASSDEALKILFLKSGAHDTFTKPLVKEEFNIKIANLLHILKNEKTIEESQKIVNEYSRALESGSILSKGDINGKITYVNDAFCEYTGYTREELIGQPHNILRHPQTPKTTFKDMWSTILRKEIWKGVVRNLRKDDTSFYARMTVVPILDIKGEIAEFIAFRDDITRLVESKQEMKDMFLTDSLTNLGNRHKLLLLLESTENILLAIVNINSFKQINNFYGEEIGNDVLVALSRELFEFCYPNEISLYRLGADEFAFAKEVKPHRVERETKKIELILEGVSKNSFKIKENEIQIGVTCGISYANRTLNNADAALKVAKSSKKKVVLFSEDIKVSKEYKNNLLWTAKVRKALDEDRIVAFYQPIIDNKSGEIVKYEALVRLIDENEKIISPIDFLEIAQQTPLYFEITQRMIKRVLNYFKDLDYDVSINITANDILDYETRKVLLDELLKFKNRKNSIVIEIVESAGITSFEEVIRFISEVKEYNVKISIDDFGTGYSNFEYLLKLSPDFIKLDGSLVKDIETNRDMYEICKTMTNFAKQQNYLVIAEYVSTEGVFENVKNIGIDYSQGYFIGKPERKVIGH